MSVESSCVVVSQGRILRDVRTMLIKNSVQYLTGIEDVNLVEIKEVDANSDSNPSSRVPSLISAGDVEESKDAQTRSVRPVLSSKDEIEFVISSLNGLARAIRKPGVNERDRRAENFVEKDADGFNVTAFFSNIADLAIEYKFPQAKKEIRQRMAKIVSDRRNRIAYLRRHREKLGKNHLDESPTLDSTAEPTHIELRVSRAANPTTRTKLARTVLSTTIATEERPDVSYLRRIPSQRSICTASVISGASVQAHGLSMPRAPDVTNKKEFTCPYCTVSHPAREALGERWP